MTDIESVRVRLEELKSRPPSLLTARERYVIAVAERAIEGWQEALDRLRVTSVSEGVDSPKDLR